MHILLVTDAWYPQVNGVVRTLDTLTRLLRAAGHRISLLTHEGKRTLGFGHIKVWTRGVDTSQFRQIASSMCQGLPRPVMLNAGRVAVEKNIEAFLALERPGTKVVVGDGPQLAELKARHPQAVFTGYLKGDELAQALSAADVFVFPSKSDTFGLVMLEALACGVPVAAFPVEGPIDVITSDRVGCLNPDLGKASDGALACRREDCIGFAGQHSWQRVAEMFEQSLVQARQMHQTTGSFMGRTRF